MSANWPHAVASSLRLSGDIAFTPTRVGKTLHVPCATGKHLVDVNVAPGVHPDAVVKRMLAKGWTIGSRLRCPDCAKRVYQARSTAGKVAGAKLQRKWAEYRDGKGERPEPTFTPKQKEQPMSLQQAAAIVAKAPPSIVPTAPTDAAKKAYRMVMMALEDYYDETNKRYKPGYDDAKIAQTTGASLAVVADAREKFYGPLGTPSELTEIKAALATLRAERLAKDQELLKGILAVEAKLERICTKNGWAL